MVADDSPSDRSSDQSAPEASGEDASPDGDRDLKTRFVEVRERLERTARQLRARERAGDLRACVRDYPVLSVLGAATLGAVLARSMSRSSGGGEGVRSAPRAGSGEEVRPEDRGDSASSKAPSNGRTGGASGGGGAGSASASADRLGGTDRAGRVGRELGELVKESAQAALLTVLTRKLNDWLGPGERADSSA